MLALRLRASMNNGRKFFIAKFVLLAATVTMGVILAFLLYQLPVKAAVPIAMQILLWWGGVAGSVLAMYGAINVVDKRTRLPNATEGDGK